MSQRPPAPAPVRPHPVVRAVDAIVERELAAFDPCAAAARAGSGSALWHARTAQDFRAARIAPEPALVLFSGGIEQECWLVTRADAYRVAYMPRAGYFSLLVSSAIGPLDIGVHGSALECFAAV